MDADFKQNKTFADLKPVMIVRCDLLENIYIYVKYVLVFVSLYISRLLCSSICHLLVHPMLYVVCLSVHLYP